jgi:mono/diheme cytochrome c family protein
MFAGAALVCLALSAEGCASKPEPEIPAAARTEAEQIFGSRCVRCHGPIGKGDGPEAATLKPRPRDFSDPTWHLAVSDRRIDQIICEGGAAVGKSAAMPANPDLRERPVVVSALRQHLRMLAGGE